MQLAQTISRGPESIAAAEVEVVAIKTGGKAARLPKSLLAVFSA